MMTAGPTLAAFVDTPLEAERDDAAMLFAGLRELSMDGEGVTRGSYSEVETRAIKFLEAFALEEGLVVSRDAGQNTYFSLPEDQDAERYVLVGSHIDSVPQGGNYDGAAGIVAGILCLVHARRAAIRFVRPVKVVAIRGEESAWFGLCYMGSMAMLGQLSGESLRAPHRETGNSLESYMVQVGVDIEAVKQGMPLIDPENIEAYLELHIEQGPVLMETNQPLAVVSGIRGNIRHRTIRCLGEPGHSGAVPREFRHDAVFAVSSLLMRLDDHWKTLLAHGGDLVVTSGIISTNQQEHAMSRIPGDVVFSFEARSEHRDVLKTVGSLLESEAKIVERERRVSFKFDEQVSSTPAVLDAEVVKDLKNAVSSYGEEPFVMASGAGHDAAVFANRGIPSGMIFVRNQNGSHNPHEAMELDDFIPATSVLYTYLAGDR